MKEQFRSFVLCFVALSCVFPLSSAHNVLIFGDYPDSQAELTGVLQFFGHSVVNLPFWPPDSSYYSGIDVVWAMYLGLSGVPPSAQQVDDLANFIASGRGAYLNGERPCCDTGNNAYQSIINSLVNTAAYIEVGSLGNYNFKSSKKTKKNTN